MYAPRLGSASTSARAPVALKVEQFASQVIREAFLHPRGARIERKGELATLVGCEFHVGNQANP